VTSPNVSAAMAQPCSDTADRARRPLDAIDPPSTPRSLSGLEFSARVLEEARDPSLPLVDRLGFVSLFSTNLDEFFRVRVGSLKRQTDPAAVETSADKLSPVEHLDRVAAHTRALLEVQHRAWREEILPALAGAGVRLVAPADFLPEQHEEARHRFLASVFPALTPLAVDQGHPFPQVRSQWLNLAVLLKRGGGRRCFFASNAFAVVQLPPALPRLVPLPSGSGEAYALLEEVVASNVADMFPGNVVQDAAVFRVTRAGRTDLDEGAERRFSPVRTEQTMRHRGLAVRLEVSTDTSREIEPALVAALRLESRDVYRISIPLQIADLRWLGGRCRDPR
jgi:polyphosphate kinase